MTEYRYKIKSTGHGSERFGPCEICKKSVRGNVYLQTEEKKYTDTDGKVHWLSSKDIFGHKTCCMTRRK